MWDPLPVAEVAELFGDAPFRWWIAGGRALDLFVGRTWRRHDDVDVGVVRADVPALRDVLAGWDVRIASGGRLSDWQGGEPSRERNENNLWCRRAGDTAWSIDVTVSDGDADHWVFRSDPAVRVPWDDAIRTTSVGVPYLAPHLQLLFKLRDPRPKDTIDALAVVPHLDDDDAALLRDRIDPGHPWAELLA